MRAEVVEEDFHYCKSKGARRIWKKVVVYLMQIEDIFKLYSVYYSKSLR